MHPLLILLIVSLTVSFLFVRGNLARYWAQNPDREDLQYQQDKAENKACINPVKEDTKHLGKMFLWVAIIIFIVALLCSCSRQLHTGYYEIESVHGSNTVTFKKVDGLWHVPGADTLKPGEKIFLKRVYRKQDANVWCSFLYQND